MADRLCFLSFPVLLRLVDVVDIANFLSDGGYLVGVHLRTVSELSHDVLVSRVRIVEKVILDPVVQVIVAHMAISPPSIVVLRSVSVDCRTGLDDVGDEFDATDKVGLDGNLAIRVMFYVSYREVDATDGEAALLETEYICEKAGRGLVSVGFIPGGTEELVRAEGGPAVVRNDVRSSLAVRLDHKTAVIEPGEVTFGSALCPDFLTGKERDLHDGESFEHEDGGEDSVAVVHTGGFLSPVLEAETEENLVSLVGVEVPATRVAYHIEVSGDAGVGVRLPAGDEEVSRGVGEHGAVGDVLPDVIPDDLAALAFLSGEGVCRVDLLE